MGNIRSFEGRGFTHTHARPAIRFERKKRSPPPDWKRTKSARLQAGSALHIVRLRAEKRGGNAPAGPEPGGETERANDAMA